MSPFLDVFCVTILLKNIASDIQTTTDTIIPHNATNEPVQRIVGGIETKISDYPYLVSIQKRSMGSMRHYCGGTIVSNRWILSAAHCFFTSRDEKLSPKDLLVVAGYTANDVRRSKAKLISYYVPHSRYSSLLKYDDIAMVLLQKSLEFDKYMQPVDLAEPKVFSTRQPWELYGPQDCHALGWGNLAWKGDRTKKLRKVELPIISNQQCQGKLQVGAYSVAETQLCTLARDNSKDTCQGDSGGPLICKGLQVGIVSFGKRCAVKDFPGFWTRVDKYFYWIYRISTMTNDSISFEELLGRRNEGLDTFHPKEIFFILLLKVLSL